MHLVEFFFFFFFFFELQLTLPDEHTSHLNLHLLFEVTSILKQALPKQNQQTGKGMSISIIYSSIREAADKPVNCLLCKL